MYSKPLLNSYDSNWNFHAHGRALFRSLTLLYLIYLTLIWLDPSSGDDVQRWMRRWRRRVDDSATGLLLYWWLQCWLCLSMTGLPLCTRVGCQWCVSSLAPALSHASPIDCGPPTVSRLIEENPMVIGFQSRILGSRGVSQARRCDGGSLAGRRDL